MPARLARLQPSELTAEQREIYGQFTTGRRVDPSSPFSLVHPDGGLMGPPNAWLLSPPLGRVLERLGAVLRFELELEDRAREMAILLVAFHRDSEFELRAHQAAGVAAGLSEHELSALASRSMREFRSAEEEAVYSTTVAILDQGTLDDAQYAKATATLGSRRLLELVILIGYYDFVATQLAVFGTGEPG